MKKRGDNSTRQDLWLPPGMTQEDFLASVTRLQAAGLMGLLTHDEATASGEFSFAPAYFKLLQAGRNPLSEDGFIVAWLSGDPLLVRLWVETEAGALEDPPEPSVSRVDGSES